ncbi:MAG: hypothetical protein ACREBU_10840, partial [Nitrososphaera sp.]
MKDKQRKLLGLIMLFCILLVLLSIFSNGLHNALQADEAFEPYEIFLTNQTSSSVVVKVEPVGMIFNDIKEYSLISAGTISGTLGQVITGTQVSISAGKIKGGVANHALTSVPNGVNRHICYGRYRMTVEGVQFYVDFSDSDYPSAYTMPGLKADLFFAVDASERVLWVSEGYPPGGSVVELHSGEIIKIWDQTPVGGSSKTQNKNGFKILAGTNIPLDGTDAVVTHITPGTLYVNANVLGNVTVSSGKTFTVTPATMLVFASNASLTVNGNLQVVGTASQMIAFDRQSPAYWYGIVINSASGSSSTIDYANIQHAIIGIQVNNALPTIKNSNIENNEEGIYLNYSSVYLENNAIKNNTGGLAEPNGVDIYYAIPTLKHNLISRNPGSGVYGYYWAWPEFGTSSQAGNNIVALNGRG